MQSKERLAQEQEDAALVKRLVPASPDSDPLPPVGASQASAQQADDDPEENFLNAIAEIDTQPLHPASQQEDICWPLVIVLLVFVFSCVGGAILALLTSPSVTVEVVPVTKTITLTTRLSLPTRALAPLTLALS